MSRVTLGPFELQERIGKGGMGDVWRAVHHSQDIAVAVKVITPRWAREFRFTDALRREVEAMARLHHAGIVRVVDFGEVPYSAASTTFGAFVEGSPFFVMEYMPGGALLFRPDRTWPETRHLVEQILDALAHAHARGVIHRDLKASNVLLNADGRPHLTDFGLARVLDRESSAPDGLSSASGTPRYMAPEQILGQWREQGPWTDLYALGCLTHYLLRGRPPYAGSVDEIFEGHLHTAPPRLEDDHLPPGLDDWLSTMLAKTPTERFRRAADAHYSLAQLDGRTGARSHPEPRQDDGYTTLAQLAQAPTIIQDAATTQLEVPERVSHPRPPAPEVFRPAPPPIPASWKPGVTPSPHGLHGVGLGIFGVRTPPLVGRVAERDIIWELFTEVHQLGLPRVVVLRGDAGTGKSRLMRWMGERAHELGAATLLQAVHSPLRGANDGLGPAIAEHLRCIGLSPRETFERVRDFWLRTGATATDFFTADALTHIVLDGVESDEVPPVKFTSPAQRWASVTEFLARCARESDLQIGNALVDEALEIWRRVGDPLGEANALRTRNWLRFWSGDHAGARECLYDARELFTQLGDSDGLGWVHYELAAIALHNEETDRASELTETAVGYFSRIGNQIAFGDCCNMRGEIARHRGELEVAEDWYRQALAIYEPLGHGNESIARENLGMTLLDAGHYEEARRALRRVLQTNETLGRMPFVLRNCAELLACDGALVDHVRWDQTFARLKRALAQTEFSDVDSAAAIEQASQFMLDGGDAARATNGFHVAADLWRRLNRTDRVTAIEQRLEELSTTEFRR